MVVEYMLTLLPVVLVPIVLASVPVAVLLCLADVLVV